jgi:hypothetical protein
MKICVLAGLGDYYKAYQTGYDSLPFVYQNLANLRDKLESMNWIVYPAMVDIAASKETILKKLFEVIDQHRTSEVEKILFYFTGHGNRYLIKDGFGYRTDVFCVTYNPLLRYDTQPPVDGFFSEFSYAEFIGKFRAKIPNGHLVTILDCCFAGGMIEDIKWDRENHTILAASSEVDSSYYDTNSLFFEAFRKAWDAPDLHTLSTKLEQNLATVPGAQTCHLRLASKFVTKPLL